MFVLFLFICNLLILLFCRHKEKADPYYKRIHAVLIVFNVSDPHSFGKLATWHGKARDLCPDGFIFLIGNKCDLKAERKIASEDATALAAKLKINYTETSANRRMAENGFAPPPPLGNFADISYLVEN